MIARPWPAPATSWVMFQRWHDLLFAHWPLDADRVRPLVPAELELDTREGTAWIAVTPFHMSGVRARGLPAVPGTSAFPELNVRTYVRYGGKPGVYFFSLDASNPLAVIGARALFKLPYHLADMRIERAGDRFDYSSRRLGGRAEFGAVYGPCGPVVLSAAGSLEHFLTERYCLYTVRDRKVRRVEIDHAPWPLQPARAEISRLGVARAAGLPLEGPPALTHFAATLDVRIWPPRSAHPDPVSAPA
jgi:uncharacterized protein YqjF (DUF2071 family)